MKQQIFGTKIAAFRKGKGMTQLELAQKLGVTDKAVSKWERDLSYPDVESIPKIAEIFDISVDELMQSKHRIEESKQEGLISLILNSVALAMGIAPAVLSLLGQIDTNSAIGMLGIGLTCLAALHLMKKSGE